MSSKLKTKAKAKTKANSDPQKGQEGDSMCLPNVAVSRH